MNDDHANRQRALRRLLQTEGPPRRRRVVAGWPGNALRRIPAPLLASDHDVGAPRRSAAARCASLARTSCFSAICPGDVGLVHKHCSHRGMSLEFGIVAEHGIRCAYHGWCFATERPDPRTPGESAEQRAQGAHLPWRLSGRRIPGPRIRVLRPAGDEAAVSAARHDGAAGQRDGAVADPLALQLAAGEREFDGPVPHAVPAYADVGRAVRGGRGASCRSSTSTSAISASSTPTRGAAATTSGCGSTITCCRTSRRTARCSSAAKRSAISAASSLTRWVVPDRRHQHLRHRLAQPQRDGRPRGPRPKREEIGWEPVDFYGQSAHRPDAQRQSNPGDWDAWVEPGPDQQPCPRASRRHRPGRAPAAQRAAQGHPRPAAGHRAVRPEAEAGRSRPLPATRSCACRRLPATTAS